MSIVMNAPISYSSLVKIAVDCQNEGIAPEQRVENLIKEIAKICECPVEDVQIVIPEEIKKELARLYRMSPEALQKYLERY